MLSGTTTVNSRLQLMHGMDCSLIGADIGRASTCTACFVLQCVHTIVITT